MPGGTVKIEGWSNITADVCTEVNVTLPFFVHFAIEMFRPTAIVDTSMAASSLSDYVRSILTGGMRLAIAHVRFQTLSELSSVAAATLPLRASVSLISVKMPADAHLHLFVYPHFL